MSEEEKNEENTEEGAATEETAAEDGSAGDGAKDDEPFDVDAQYGDSEAGEGASAEAASETGEGVKTLDSSLPSYLQELPVKVEVILGSIKLSVKELMACGPGTVLDVGKKVTDPFDLYVNNVMVARGEIVMIHDRIGLKIVEVMDTPEEQLRKQQLSGTM